MEEDSDCVIIEINVPEKEDDKKKRGKRKKVLSNSQIKRQKIDAFCQWTYVEELSSQLSVPLNTSKEIVKLLDNDNTVPFIARYRKEQTGNMDASKLREFVDCYENLKIVRTKVNNAIKSLSTQNKMTPDLHQSFLMVTTLEDFEHLHQPLKSTKTTLAERARSLGLEPIASKLLSTPNEVQTSEICSYRNPAIKDLETLTAVEDGIKHIIADFVAKNCDILNFVKERFNYSNLVIETKVRNSVAKKTATKPKLHSKDNSHKFEYYNDFSRKVDKLESHQILAINRGENLKYLTVKINIPQFLTNEYLKFAFAKIIKNKFNANNYVQKLLNEGIEESLTRFIRPLVSRRTRSYLTKMAEKSAVSVFVKNLKNLLLSPPVTGKVVLGIDPGFTNGCKIAVISPLGNILHTTTLYLHVPKLSQIENDKLMDIINNHKCEVIGIGNGTACRETEETISRLLQSKMLYSTNITFCIVNESGISIYSVSDEAASELPNIEPNIRSAVSLARRIIDPLSEYIKVDPKHLGVGMYQHDVTESTLKKMLSSTVEDCINEVGVELNTCNSIVLLSKVAGLTETKAKNILGWKKIHGFFRNREQLKLVPGIGAKTYEQCAGFLRIRLNTSDLCAINKDLLHKITTKSRSKTLEVDESVTVLDRTIIHPETYSVVYKLLSLFGLHRKDIGSSYFINKVKSFVKSENEIKAFAEKLEVGIPTLSLIVDGLQKSLDYDIRSEHMGPLFKTSIRNMESLHPNLILTGKVMNVTDFGAFVDVGVGTNGLIHRSKMKIGTRAIDLLVGDIVEVDVLQVDHSRLRISLNLIKLCK